MRRAFTLVEMVFVIVIASILSVATFKGVSYLLLRGYKAKLLTTLSLQTQIALDQIGNYLSWRIPATTIGYDPKRGDFAPISAIGEDRFKILEWFGADIQSFENGAYSRFVDMRGSDPATHTLDSPGFDESKLLYDKKDYNLLFSGSFDQGAISDRDFANAFGWHGHESTQSYDVTFSHGKIVIDDSVQPPFIYEKYYLTHTAYALARGEDVDRDAPCIKKLPFKEKKHLLLLFYDYRPWRQETFCADPKGSGQSGKVAVLLENVSGFQAYEQDYTIRMKIDVKKRIKGTMEVHLTKQKVLF